MIDIKIGQILLRKFNGCHSDSRLVVLYDRKTEQRVLCDLDHGVVVGPVHALYARVTTDSLTKAQVKEVSNVLGLSNA
ncbi:MAG: hypothetical protein GY942_20540 [Aestuariibacter sp.]|nr:hypothetical protein [Aestuariibacter sp.]